MSTYVIVTKAPSMDYKCDYVSLPKNYGLDAYLDRPDVKAIIQTVADNLSALDEKIHFLTLLKGKKVIIKPNLVSVFHKFGFQQENYPETTDPRVIDAVIRFIKPHAKDIVIAESSGRGVPTRMSFKATGLDRLAKHHNTGLVALEELPVDRYILPKAHVMKEILIPNLFSEIVHGNAFYISLPKMKTNLYTGVTLGFKNAMGVIPYNLRQRNHNFLINEKLVDMLYLFKPNLVIIDGLVGGEGNTPAPVDPVESRFIVSGNNSVETDREATRLMGFDPNQIKLISHATKLGFGDPKVQIIGKETPVKFKPAEQSLLGDAFHVQFPNVELLVGHTVNHAPQLTSLDEATPAWVVQNEQACVGGCLASIRTALDYIRYQGHTTAFSLIVILGTGIPLNGKKYYFNRKGKAFTSDDIARLSAKKISLGTCTQSLQSVVDTQIMGCMPKPAMPVFKIFSLLGIKNHIMNPMKKQIRLPPILCFI